MLLICGILKEKKKRSNVKKQRIKHSQGEGRERNEQMSFKEHKVANLQNKKI